MKHKIFFIICFALIIDSNAQQNPTPNPATDPTTGLPAPQKGQYAWFRGGNLGAGNPAGTNNIFGTLWNSPIYTYTNGVGREVILGNITSSTTVAAGNLPKNGFHGINTNDPWSRLHIVNGLNSICAGYRAWMREGLNI